MFLGKKTGVALDQLGSASVIGLHMVSGILVGLAVGYWLDKTFDTKPCFLLIFLIIGIIAGYINIFREFSMMQKREAKSGEDNRAEKN